LPALVERWEMAAEVEGPRCVVADLDGDRRDEYLFLVTFDADSGPDSGPRPSDMWIFEDAEEDFRLFNSARALANALTADLQIRDVDDYTGDGLPDLVATYDDS